MQYSPSMKFQGDFHFFWGGGGGGGYTSLEGFPRFVSNGTLTTRAASFAFPQRELQETCSKSNIRPDDAAPFHNHRK